MSRGSDLAIPRIRKHHRSRTPLPGNIHRSTGDKLLPTDWEHSSRELLLCPADRRRQCVLPKPDLHSCPRSRRSISISKQIRLAGKRRSVCTVAVQLYYERLLRYNVPHVASRYSALHSGSHCLDAMEFPVVIDFDERGLEHADWWRGRRYFYRSDNRQ